MGVCILCGGLNRANARFCIACGSLLAVRVCPGCKQVNKVGARFCMACGKALVVVCSGCHRHNRLQARFCQHCGSPLVRQCPHCSAVVPAGVRICHHCGMDPTSVQPATPPPGLLGQRYRIQRPIARGGMGAVYLVRDEKSGADWALKELSLERVKAEDLDETVEQFRREAQLLATLAHPNLIKVVDSFSEQGKEYLVMEYVEGKTLDAVAKGGRLDEGLVLAYGFQMCDVLEYLHSQRPPIIYRDLKPSNVMVETNSDILKLIDFGIARSFKPGKKKDTHLLGTPGFAPPEQYGKGQTDERSDIFTFGVLLHVLLTNYDVEQNMWNYPPVCTLNPGVSPSLEQVIVRATALPMEKRFPSVTELRKALLRCKGGRRIAGSLPTAGLK